MVVFCADGDKKELHPLFYRCFPSKLSTTGDSSRLPLLCLLNLIRTMKKSWMGLFYLGFGCQGGEGSSRASLNPGIYIGKIPRLTTR